MGVREIERVQAKAFMGLNVHLQASVIGEEFGTVFARDGVVAMSSTDPIGPLTRRPFVIVLPRMWLNSAGVVEVLVELSEKVEGLVAMLAAMLPITVFVLNKRRS